MLNTQLSPMLLGKRATPFNNKDYIFEWKADGVRCLLHKDGDQVSLFSRHSTNCTTSFPEFQEIKDRIQAKQVVLDGELVVLHNGKPAFDLTMKRFMVKGKNKLVKDYPVKFLVWDILFLDGKSIVDLPLLKRKEILGKLLDSNDLIVAMDYIEEHGDLYFSKLKDLELEGMVAKRKDSKYIFRRSDHWLKIKNYRTSECSVLGYRLDKPGVYLSEDSDGEAKYSGNCELGFHDGSYFALQKAAEEIVTKRDKDFVWLEPLIKCKVKHIGKDSRGRFREASFLEFVV